MLTAAQQIADSFMLDIRSRLLAIPKKVPASLRTLPPRMREPAPHLHLPAARAGGRHQC